MTQVKTVAVGRRTSLWSKIPWAVLIILYMTVVHVTSLSMTGVAGYIFMGICLFVVFAEFFKSGDIGPGPFLLDLASAIGCVIVATVLMTYLCIGRGEAPSFFDWVGCAVILGDAVFSPFNAFRTALRNVGLDTAAV